jgi:putative Holliday junction resolvase
MRFLAIDYGEKRLGLAVCDEAETFASPYGAHERQGVRLDVNALVEMMRGLGIEGIVLGLPRSLDPERSQENETKVRKFAAKLDMALQSLGRTVPIDYWDERFSTREAQAGLREAGISQRQGRGDNGSSSIDARAAAVILQGYLDRRRAIADASATGQETIMESVAE